MTDRAADVNNICRISSHNKHEHSFLISKLIELCNIYKRGNQANIDKLTTFMKFFHFRINKSYLAIIYALIKSLPNMTKLLL